MDVQIKSHNLKLTDELKSYVERRVAKLDRVTEGLIEAKFELREEPHNRRADQRFVAQFTIATRRAILRAEERNAEVHAATDLVVDKMARQIRRFHDRRIDRGRRDAVNLGQLAADQAPEIALSEDDGDEEQTVVRLKRFKVQPMDLNEAIEQIELLGHDFYVFYNPDTSRMNVMYRRKDGGFGVLEPELG